jgi:hypothetical protein
MAEASNLSGLISAAVAEKMTPEFIEKEVNSRVEKLIVESVGNALQRWSDTGKLIEKAIADCLRVDRLDLPSYGNVVAAMVKTQIEATVAPLIAGQLAADMDELLKLAPMEVKLSEIADEMRKQHEDKYGEVITVILEHHEYGSTSVYLDEDEVRGRNERFRCDYNLHIDKDGRILSARINEQDIKSSQYLGRSYGLAQKIRAYFACGTTIILDESDVVTSVGDR